MIPAARVFFALLFAGELLGLAQTASPAPELILQQGHSDEVSRIVISRDGSWFVTGGEDKRLIVWDAASLRELRSIALDDKVEALDVSADGKWIATGTRDHPLFVRVDDFALTVGEGKRTRPGAIFFMPGGDRAVSVDQFGGQVRLWDVASGKQVGVLGSRLLSDEYECCVRSAALSHDGKTLAVYMGQGKQGHLVLIDTTIGERRTLDVKLTVADENYAVRRIKFSPDDKIIMVCGQNGIELVSTLPRGGQRTIAPKTAAFDAQFLTSTRIVIATPLGIAVCDLAACEEPQVHGSRNWPNTLTVDARGEYVLEGASTGAVYRWDLHRMEVAKESQPRPRILDVEFSADGDTLAAGSSIEMYRLWDLVAGQPGERRRDTVHQENQAIDRGESIHFLASDEIVSSGTKHALMYRLHSSAAPQQVADSYPTEMEMFHRKAFAVDAANGRVAFVQAAGDKNSLHVRDLEGKNDVIVQEDEPNIERMSFSPDGALLAVSSSSVGFDLYDWRARTTKISLKKGSYAHAFSPDGKLIAVGGTPFPLYITIYEVETGQPLAILATKETMVEPKVLAFNHDGTILASAGESNAIYLWEVKPALRTDILERLKTNDWTVFENIVAANRPVTLDSPVPGTAALAFSPDKRWLTTGSRDGAIRFWDWKNRRLAVTAVSGARLADWLVYTPDAQFDGSPSMWSSVNWRLSGNTFSVLSPESAFRRLYRPGLLASVLTGETPPAAQQVTNTDAPHVDIARVDGPVDDVPIDSRTVRLRLTTSDPKHAGIRDLRLFRNGKLVRIWRGALKPCAVEAEVSLVVGRNDFTANSYSEAQVKSIDSTVLLEGSSDLRRKGVAYVVAIGIDAYRNPNYRLRYARADASLMGSVLTQRLRELGSYREVREVEIPDADATRNGILEALGRLAYDAPAASANKAWDSLLPAQPEDGIFLYYAGHGYSDAQHFYFLPQNFEVKKGAGARQVSISSLISDTDLQAILEKVDAGTFMLIIDACNSGQILETQETRYGPLDSPGLGQLAYDKDMYVLTASQAYQGALESSRAQHGLLTYALVLEGLQQMKADYWPKNGEITVDEWFRYAARRVPELWEEEPAGRLLGTSGATGAQRPRFFLRNDLTLEPALIAR